MLLSGEGETERRPLFMTLLAALYFFFFFVSVSTFGNPYPFMGEIYRGTAAQFLVFADSLACLYLFLGIFHRQQLTWKLLLFYNGFQMLNTVVNLNFIPLSGLEAAIGERISQDGLWMNNMIAVLGMLLLTQYIYRKKSGFTNPDRYLF